MFTFIKYQVKFCLCFLSFTLHLWWNRKHSWVASSASVIIVCAYVFPMEKLFLPFVVSCAEGQHASALFNVLRPDLQEQMQKARDAENEAFQSNFERLEAGMQVFTDLVVHDTPPAGAKCNKVTKYPHICEVDQCTRCFTTMSGLENHLAQHEKLKVCWQIQRTNIHVSYLWTLQKAHSWVRYFCL